ncbi:metallophosphoesterase [Bacteriovorax sp. PP10]|uniref:Metallophosphoesterase n=1 Tax=Bacteriovorax antarcticus TaxID=3088717 RepID=A0ABU5VZE8_9BACT|nr:metallophosphoesterase [Bacteriovorax sp. PP10]MEA9358429.1 metallophosphoesterase [Bacteriovorax sp. PP10]
MTILPTILSGLLSIVLWFYIRNTIKRNIADVFKIKNIWLYVFDILFIYCAFFRFIYRLQNSFIHGSSFYFLMNLSYVLLGLIGLVVIMCIILDISNLAEKWMGKPNVPESDNSRRNFLKKNLILTGLGSATLVTGVGFHNSFEPKIVKVNIPLPPDHKNLNGLKIVQLSDMHIGPTLKKDFCEILVKEVNALNPDIIAITGDSIDGEVKFLKDDMAPFLNLKARLGVYYITGNHEYYWYANEWIEWARTSGLNPLINENVKLNYNNTDFYLAGVNDPSADKLDKDNASDPKKAAFGIPKEAYKILLAHQPKSCFKACKEGFHTQLSGHTHGGQGFPWSILVYLIQPYVRGLNVHEGMNLYVHSGTGFWGPPNRFMINSEIAEIVFTSSEKV